MSLQIAYVANHGTRIDVAQNINNPASMVKASTYDPFNVAFGKTASVTQYFLGFSTNYESLQAQLTRRSTKDLTFISAFTWGKAQGYRPALRTECMFFARQLCAKTTTCVDFDRKLNFEQTVTYELPAGPATIYFNSGIGRLRPWRLETSAIIGTVSGLPFTVTSSSVTPGTTQTANLTAPLSGHA